MQRLFILLFTLVTFTLTGQNRLQQYYQTDSLLSIGEFLKVTEISNYLLDSDSVEFRSMGYMLRGMVNEHKSEDSLALLNYNRSIKAFPNNTPALSLKANWYLYRDQLDSALTYKLLAIDNLTDSYSSQYIAELLSDAGYIFFLRNNLEKGEEAMEFAVQYDSLDWYSFALLAEMQMGLNKGEKALSNSQKAYQLDSSKMYAVYLLAASNYMVGNNDEAERLANISVQDTLQFYPSNSLLADIYANSNREDEALVLLKLNLQKYPDDYLSLNNIAFINMQRGHYRESIKYFDRCIDIDPSLAFAYNNKAWCLFQLGMHHEALTLCEKSITIDPNNSWAYANRAKIYFALNMSSKGCENTTKAEELGYPNFEELEELRSKCK